jgi:ADP-ribosylglycohydrolase
MKPAEALLGALVGEALGVPVEGLGRDEFEPVVSMRGGGTHQQPAGTYSSGGSMTLCTLESLLEKQDLDEADLGDRLLRFYFNRHWTARHVPLGIGFTTREAIVRIREGKKAAEAGLDDEDSNGNAPLTRLLPVALFARAKGLSPRETVALAHRAAKITHAHPRAQLCSGFYALVVRSLMDGARPEAALAFMREQAQELYASDPWNAEYRHVQGLMERGWRAVDRVDVHSDGYVVHTLEAALWCLLRGESYRECVLEAVNLGVDADSLGGIVGGLAAIAHGGVPGGGVPEEWRRELARREEIEALAVRFADTFFRT